MAHIALEPSWTEASHVRIEGQLPGRCAYKRLLPCVLHEFGEMPIGFHGLGLDVVPLAFDGDAPIVADLLERLEKGAKVAGLKAGRTARGFGGNVDVLDQRAVAG